MNPLLSLNLTGLPLAVRGGKHKAVSGGGVIDDVARHGAEEMAVDVCADVAARPLARSGPSGPRVAPGGR